MVRTPGPTPLHVTYGPNAEPRSLSQLLLREAGRHALVNGQVAVPGGGHLSRCSSLSRHPPGCRPWGRRTAFGRSGRRARITCGRRKGGGWGGTGRGTLINRLFLRIQKAYTKTRAFSSGAAARQSQILDRRGRGRTPHFPPT